MHSTKRPRHRQRSIPDPTVCVFLLFLNPRAPPSVERCHTRVTIKQPHHIHIHTHKGASVGSFHHTDCINHMKTHHYTLLFYQYLLCKRTSLITETTTETETTTTTLTLGMYQYTTKLPPPLMEQQLYH
mmetsp:Transcript_19990/g.55602  ORF Transcript_19990/g.55602 Transcript_19990/m.55602 type:complete len:129 (+) Transcript_19990:1441-1827(+)